MITEAITVPPHMMLPSTEEQMVNRSSSVIMNIVISLSNMIESYALKIMVALI